MRAPSCSSSSCSKTWRACLEHLALLFLDVVLDVLLHDLELGAPRLVGDVGGLELAHDLVHDVVLLEPLEHDVARLRVRLERRVEDLLLDPLVEDHLLLQLRE